MQSLNNDVIGRAESHIILVFNWDFGIEDIELKDALIIAKYYNQIIDKRNLM